MYELKADIDFNGYTNVGMKNLVDKKLDKTQVSK